MASLGLDEKNQIFKAAEEAAQLGANVLKSYYGNLPKVSKKELAGLVTEADLESEKVITEHLLKKYPKYSILGEEQAFDAGYKEESESEGRWIIDPLDGTTNYVHQFHIFCISIGFEYKGKTLVGLVHVPLLGQTFKAIKGHGAFLNDQPISCSDKRTITDSLLATGFFPEDKKALGEQLKIFSHLISQARGVRRSGSAAYDLCMVAQGVFDLFWEKNLSPWDTSAGALLVEEAGGKVTTYTGDEYNPFKKSIVASNQHLNSYAVEQLKSHCL